MYKTWYARAERDAEAERNKAAASEEANRARGGSSRDPCDHYSPASSSAPSSSLDALEEDEDLLAQETRVGQRLSELTTRRVIVGVLGMLFVLPLFDLDAYPPAEGDATEDFRRGGLEMLHAAAGAARRAADAEFAEAEREREEGGIIRARPTANPAAAALSGRCSTRWRRTRRGRAGCTRWFLTG